MSHGPLERPCGTRGSVSQLSVQQQGLGNRHGSMPELPLFPEPVLPQRNLFHQLVEVGVEVQQELVEQPDLR